MAARRTQTVWTPPDGGVWSLREGAAETKDRVFTRPMGALERAFHWDGVFDGVSDTVIHQVVDVTATGSHCFTDDSFRRAWRALKRRLHIISAHIKEDSSSGSLEFVVFESRLGEMRQGELEMVDGDATTAKRLLKVAMNGPRQLSEDMLVSITVVRCHPNTTFHVIYRVAHVISDGLGSSTLVRNFLDCVASPADAPAPELADKLALAVSCDFVSPSPLFSPARRRWRTAIACILWDRWKKALRGGHGLPNYYTAQTATTPAQSKEILVTLPASTSHAILRVLRSNGITFGQALPVIGQVALSRLLRKRRAQGRIDEAEWQLRLRERMHTISLLNVRPLLNQGWVDAGGMNEMNIFFLWFTATLPPMPRTLNMRADATKELDFSSLLSQERFFLRCNLVKKQLLKWHSHPLLHELSGLQARDAEHHRRKGALSWRRRQAGVLEPTAGRTGNASDGTVWTHAGGSLGDLNKWVPVDYPLLHNTRRTSVPTHSSSARDGSLDTASPTPTSSVEGLGSTPTNRLRPSGADAASPQPLLRLLSCETHLRCRPAELYLGSSTWCGQMSLFVYYDGNVFKDDDVREWLDSIRDATLWYLGGDGRVEDNSMLRAKL